MKTFTDNAGRAWTVALNIDAIKRIRSLAGVDLLAGDLAALVEKLLGDPVTLCDVIFAAVKPAADEQKVSDADFGRAMAGDPIDLATRALLEELVNFTPNPRDRARMARVIATAWRMIDRTADLLDARTDDQAMEREMDKALAEIERAIAAGTTPGPSSGSSPASSESTPAP